MEMIMDERMVIKFLIQQAYIQKTSAD